MGSAIQGNGQMPSSRGKIKKDLKIVRPFECSGIYGVDGDHSDKIIMVKYKHFHYNFQTLGGFSISLVLLVKRQRLCWFG